MNKITRLLVTSVSALSLLAATACDSDGSEISDEENTEAVVDESDEGSRDGSVITEEDKNDRR